MNRIHARALGVLLALASVLGAQPAHARTSIATYVGFGVGPTIACGVAAPAQGVGGACFTVNASENTVQLTVTDAVANPVGGWAYWSYNAATNPENLVGLSPGFIFCGTGGSYKPSGAKTLVVVLWSSPLHSCNQDMVPTTGTIKAVFN